jgi:hypothetical protein
MWALRFSTNRWVESTVSVEVRDEEVDLVRPNLISFLYLVVKFLYL